MSEATIETRLTMLEAQGENASKTMQKVEAALGQMAESLRELQFAEARRTENFKALERAFQRLDSHEQRDNNIEQRVNSLDKELEVVRWLRSLALLGVTGILGLVGLSVWQMTQSRSTSMPPIEIKMIVDKDGGIHQQQ